MIGLSAGRWVVTTEEERKLHQSQSGAFGQQFIFIANLTPKKKPNKKKTNASNWNFLNTGPDNLSFLNYHWLVSLSAQRKWFSSISSQFIMHDSLWAEEPLAVALHVRGLTCEGYQSSLPEAKCHTSLTFKMLFILHTFIKSKCLFQVRLGKGIRQKKKKKKKKKKTSLTWK